MNMYPTPKQKSMRIIFIVVWIWNALPKPHTLKGQTLERGLDLRGAILMGGLVHQWFQS